MMDAEEILIEATLNRNPEEIGEVKLQDQKQSLRERWQYWLGPWRTYFWILFVVVSVGDHLIHPEKSWPSWPSLSIPTWAQARPFLVLLLVEALILLAVGITIGGIERLRWHTAFKLTLLMVLLLTTTTVMILAAVAVFELMH